MKKYLLIAVASFGSVFASAQITITSSDMPNSNDSILTSLAAGTGADLSLTDTAYTWDFSSLTPVIQRWEKFDAPSTFPSPYNLLFSPLTCSYGKDNYQLTTLPIPGLSFEAAYDFLKESSTTYRQVGAGYVINGGIPLPFLYTSSDVIFRFPLDYLDNDTCQFQFGLPIPSIGYYGQTGNRYSTVDGWGTLITPYGTYDVIRQVSLVTAIDTLYIDALGFGTYIPRPDVYQYKWIANGMKVPVLEIDATDVGGSPVITNVQYIDTLQPGVPQVGIVENTTTEVNVYPNPFSDQTVFEFSDASAEKLIITDITGKQIALESIQGATRYTFRRNELSSGMYFYRVSSKDQNIISKGKLIIR